MSQYQLRLSIGLPVYNGENFIREALDSILNQTFQDFELIISDNASTDKTEEICREYVARDSRIRYYRNTNNLGGSPNFNRTFELSRGEYFKWAAHDDILAPNFLEKCIQVLDENPGVVLCHSQVSIIDENRQFLKNYELHLHADSPKPHKRFHALMAKHLCYPCFGVIRSSALKKTPLFGSYGAADAILLLRLGLLGKFYEIPEYLFFARSHAKHSLKNLFPDYLSFTQNNASFTLNMLPDFGGYAVWFDSSNTGKILFPHWRIFWEYLRSAWMGKMNLYQRLCCHISIVTELKGTEPLLVKDIVNVGQILARRLTDKLMPR